VACMVPVSAPGVKIINTTYAPRHEDTRDFPISGNHHTPEGFVIFDDVFVPTERVFLDGNPELAGVFAHSLGLWERLGGLAGMARSYEALVGFARRAVCTAHRVAPALRHGTGQAHGAAYRTNGGIHRPRVGAPLGAASILIPVLLAGIFKLRQ